MASAWEEKLETFYVRRCGEFHLSLIGAYQSNGLLEWRASCHPLFFNERMASPSLQEAQCQAAARLQVFLEEALDDLTNTHKE